MFVNDQDKMSNPYREPSIDASYQVSVHLAKRVQRRTFLETYIILFQTMNDDPGCHQTWSLPLLKLEN
jgi:hypothetical protein